MIAIGGLVNLLVLCLVAGLIYWLVMWVVGQIGPPEPVAKIIRVLAAVILALVLINALLSLFGHPIVRL